MFFSQKSKKAEQSLISQSTLLTIEEIKDEDLIAVVGGGAVDSCVTEVNQLAAGLSITNVLFQGPKIIQSVAACQEKTGMVVNPDNLIGRKGLLDLFGFGEQLQKVQDSVISSP